MPVALSSRWAGRALAALVLAASVGASATQQAPTVLLVARPEPGKTDFVDISYHLVPALGQSGRMQAIAYKATLPAVRAALDQKRLTQADLAEPLTNAGAHRVALAIGATYILYLGSNFSREGLSASAELEALGPAGAWNSILTTRLRPYKEPGKKASLGEGVHVQVAILVDQVTAAVQGRSPGSGTQGVRNIGPLGGPERGTGAGAAGGAGATQPGPKDPAGATPPEPVRDTGPAASLTTARPVSSTPATSYETQIERARRDGDQAALIVGLRRAINEKPRDTRLRRELVEAYRERGMTEAARAEVQRALALNPDDAALRKMVADELADSGDPAGALKHYEEAARLAPKDAEVVVALGDAYWNAARPDDAAKTYMAAAQADPKSALPHRRLARFYLQKDRFADCVAEVTLALKLSPSDDASMNADYGQLLLHAETGLTDLLAKLQTVRKGVMDGTTTREVAFQQVSDAKKRAEDLGVFLDGLPVGPFARVQAAYSQAANLVVQAAEASLDFLESRNAARDEEATRRRVEAGRGLADSNRRLRALLGVKPSG